HEQAEEAQRHHHADDRVQPARGLAAAEQRGQPVQRGVEEGETRQQQHHRADRGEPVVGAGEAAVAAHLDRPLPHDGVAAGDESAIRAHDLSSPSSRASPSTSACASRSSSALTLLARPSRPCRATPAIAAPAATRPAVLTGPFQASTVGEICGSAGSPAYSSGWSAWCSTYITWVPPTPCGS